MVSEVLMKSGMSGPALVRKINKSYPSTGVMLMTGFTDQQLDPSVPFLAKPFTVTTLVDRVQEVLSKNRRIAEARLRAYAC